MGRQKIRAVMAFIVVALLAFLWVSNRLEARVTDREKCDFLADTMTNHPNQVVDLEYSPSGNKLASAHFHGALCVWDFDKSAFEPFEMLTLGGVRSIDWVQDDHQLVYVTSNKGRSYVITLDADSAQIQRMRVSDNAQSRADYHPTRNLLVFAEKQYNTSNYLDMFFEEVVYLYNPQSGQDWHSIAIMQTDSPGGGFVEDIAWHPSLPLLVVVGREGKIAVLSVRENKPVMLSYWFDDLYLNSVPDLPMYSVDWQPNEPDILLTVGGDRTEGRLLLWQLGEETVTEPLASLEGHTGTVLTARFSPDGRWIASTDMETVRIWDYETHENVATVEFPIGVSMAWHPDGRELALGSSSGVIRIYEFHEGQLSHKYDLLSPISE